MKSTTFISILIATLLSVLSLSSIAATEKSKLSDADPTIRSWGKDYPEHVEMYMMMKDTSKPTEYGGNTPYSKLIRFPQLTELWAGYAFAVDFNEERGHYYTQIDQYETKRNDKEFLNSHGFAKFNGQPGACMNCHSGWVPELVREMGWQEFNRTPYWDTVAKLKEQHGEGIHGAEMGSTCADCHAPDDMSLRVTRPAYINAMVGRGYEADAKHGLKSSQEDMRNHVCQQCHVEYYFKGKNKELTFPWSNWPKDKPLKVEMIEEYYDNARASGSFKQDWTHKTTKAPMLKMQHPETEMTSSGRHTRDGVTCVDCHMPEKTVDGKKLTNHTLESPLNELTACIGCHDDQSEKQIRAMVRDVQRYTVKELNDAEKAILVLIEDIKKVREDLAKKPEFHMISDNQKQETAISKAIQPALEMHRRASMRWDFVGAENSSGIHSPREAWRVLADAIKLAKEGQVLLKESAEHYGIEVKITTEATIPPAPEMIDPGNIVGSMPPEITKRADY